jgi:salicylate hydroxylase
MMPHQSQGACQAIEDAGALGIIFSAKYPQFTNNVEAGLALYNQVRYPRATRVQESSKRALENLNERIGFSSLPAHEERLAASQNKLTVAEMNRYVMADEIQASVECVEGSTIDGGSRLLAQL